MFGQCVILSLVVATVLDELGDVGNGPQKQVFEEDDFTEFEYLWGLYAPSRTLGESMGMKILGWFVKVTKWQL